MRSAMPQGFKQAAKLDKPILTPCKLSDCLFFEGRPSGEEEICRCSHPQKASEKASPKCMLYRLDWVKKMNPMSSAGVVKPSSSVAPPRRVT